MVSSCKLELTRFSPLLRIKDGAECGKNFFFEKKMLKLLCQRFIIASPVVEKYSDTASQITTGLLVEMVDLTLVKVVSVCVYKAIICFVRLRLSQSYLVRFFLFLTHICPATSHWRLIVVTT